MSRHPDEDIHPVGSELYFLPVHTRMPLKFGGETVEYVTCARCRITVQDGDGRTAHGWGETPLSVTWVWPSTRSYDERHASLQTFCRSLADAWASFPTTGHAIEVGHVFITERLHPLLDQHNARAEKDGNEPMPWLAALVCCSAFDIALHDAYGNLHGVDIYNTYNADWMSRSLSEFLIPAEGTTVSFDESYPEDFFTTNVQTSLPAWHLVGGVDPLDQDELTGTEPDDDFPVVLSDWIQRDGLKCLKIKLRGNDASWDYDRLIKTGGIALENSCDWLTADFNCMVTDPSYVNTLLDRLRDEHPRLYGMLLYVEQPFPYELSEHPIDVHSVSARKPLFLDESAHDWQQVRHGRALGWNGVALKTCKTQTGALLSACWARAHGMELMVQDLTNPMLAQIPHVRLAAHIGTIKGVETNGMQFYPEASACEAKVHPGLYRRRNGKLDLSTISGSGFGYRLDEIHRDLPAAAHRAGKQ
ncbi:MAG: L-alanine-DL-glutamate epimerase-like enolase superfamily enzyme [Verrucomicrobiales bacterium]|jgi:L-alanine-DL-glutamate epimerase-like enolase superfamily enzyme